MWLIMKQIQKIKSEVYLRNQEKKAVIFPKQCAKTRCQFSIQIIENQLYNS